MGLEAGAQGALQGRPDNSPYSPSSDVAPSAALAAPRPLKTSYLLAIKPFTLPAKDKTLNKRPLVSQPDFLEHSTVKEETGSETETEETKPFYKKIICARQRDDFYIVIRYVNMTIVTIVFILIALVALINLWVPICRTAGRIWYGEGKIRLEDDPNKKELIPSHHVVCNHSLPGRQISSLAPKRLVDVGLTG
ncbi:hypothetical protein BJ170DRAFT_684238 [Xylariales sp. AK1849]|nr:hypothetical protein BJ170DRAFT_684238 [Xylariales sp. AK1849]